MSSNTEPQKLLKEALVEMRNMRSRIKRLEQSKIEPIAIIGMDCRFPSGANNPDAYWKILSNGVDGIVEVPRSRWDIDEYYDSNPHTPGKMYSRYGGFIENVDLFDPQFFGISPREAESIDPQQRLLLEVSYTALENSRECPEKLQGSKTSVFIGQCFNDYSRRSINSGDLSRINALNCLGNTSSISAGRIAYVLGLQGPTLQLDTTCSSSLVAVHLACQNLRNKESNLAIAGGVNLMLSPEVSIGACRLEALSPDGRCKTFDADADGYVRGEGCGIVILKRLSDALSDNNNILAVIKGSAVNHDGKSNGLTAPNGKAQEAVILEALANARVQPEKISYVEAHGTGTSLGDPIEALALGKVFNQDRENKLKIGSVKTNIGHLESAAGIASLIKVILALQHKAIPPHLNYSQPSPYIPWEKLPIEVCDRLTEWNTETRIAGVSSFGMSGTNAHIIVEETPKSLVNNKKLLDVNRPLHILTLSAKTESALKQLPHDYLDYLTTHTDLSIEDICFSANTGRSHFTNRLTILADSTQQLRQNLLAFTAQQQSPTIFQQPSKNCLLDHLKIAFMFTGQGSQYVGMARQLYQTQPSFRQTIEQCDQILQPYLEKSLLSVLYPEDDSNSPIHQTAYTQPALFAVEYALAQLWQSWGILPDLVMGHSLGEYVAATIAGVFSLEDGLMLVAQRAKLMQALPSHGTMLAVLADEETVTRIIEPYSADISIAAVNTSENTVLSGKNTVMKLVIADFTTQGIEIRPLNVSHAFHSPLMQPMLEEFEQVARQITYSPPQIKLVSNVTGDLINEEIATAEYWCRHIISPVQFQTGIKTIDGEGCNVLIEIGSKPILLGMARSIFSANKILWLPSLYPKHSDWQQMLESLSQLYLNGVEIDWKIFDQDYSCHRIPLPNYPFQRQSYWIEETLDNKQFTTNTSQTTSSTIVTDLLNRGDAVQLNQLLSETEELSSSQLTAQKAIEKLIQKHHQQLKTASNQDLLYEVKWRLKPFPVKQQSLNDEPKNWLILADSKGYADSLSEILTTQGDQCTLVYLGETFKKIRTNAWQIKANDRESLKLLLVKITQDSAVSLKGIIYFWSLDMQPNWQLKLDSLQNSQTTSCGGILTLVQTLVKCDLETLPRLWLITKGAVAFKQSSLSMSQASLWGLGKTIALEHPALWGGMIDLDPAQQNLSEELEAITKQLNDTNAESNIAFRHQKRYVSRLVESSLKFHTPSDVKLKADSTYLITGGLGALGLELAQWMTRKGAKHLVLLSRSKPTSANKSTIAQIEQTGTEVKVFQADVSSSQDLHEVFVEIQDSLPPLRGVIHAAGVLKDGVLQQQSWENFTQVMKPKVEGSWNLHLLTQNLSLDFLVFFSSAASLLGAPGQGNYATANAFMDALACYRRSQNLPGLSINWAPWDNVGMAANLRRDYRTRIAQQGMNLIDLEQGLQVLEQLLLQKSPQISVLSVNWRLFEQQLSYKKPLPFLSELIDHKEVAAESKKLSIQQQKFLQKLKSAPIKERQQLLSRFLQQQIAQVLRYDLSHQLPDTKLNFFDIGLDSLMAVEFKNQLEESLGQTFSSTLIFNHHNIETLAKYLSQQLFASEASSNEHNLLEVKNPDQKIGEPIAIIGMGCRFPGADSPASFWELLKTGADLVSEIPTERWNINAFYDSNPDASGKMYTRHGGFLSNIDSFDSRFFGISPREAISLDPQQRLLLEVSWEALENAGQIPRHLAGSQTGVFIGIGQNDYARLGMKLNDSSIIDAYSGTGNSFSFAAGRLSYILGLQGPSIAIDTACSSSLVAIHQACQSIQAGECDLALAGGVQLIISPETFIFLSKARALSPDGHCKPFDADADGFGRGEGCGVIVLKRLSDAMADEDNILAVVRGSAVNHNGASSGLTVPNSIAQQKLIRQALKTAKVKPDEISYIETHGTGTSLGDPIEVEALGSVFQSKLREKPLVIGSVKANIGHLEAAGGIAGLLKVVLALQHRAIPPQINFEIPSPQINWDKLPLEVPIELHPWNDIFHTRIAGVSSFGISGTNAHIIVEQAPENYVERKSLDVKRPLHLLALTAKTETALKQLAHDYLDYLTNHPDLAVEDICFSANTGREKFTHRLTVLLDSTQQLQQNLLAFTTQQQSPNTFCHLTSKTPFDPLKIAFIFTGQGSQCVGMAQQLYQTQPSFRQTIEQCQELLKPYLEHSLLSVLYPEDEKKKTSLIHQTEYAQPAIFAVEYALAKLWQSWGIEPDVVMGHSLGEYVAATIAGVFSLEDGLKLVAQRAKLMQSLPTTGMMVAVFASELEVAKIIESYSTTEVTIAAVNTPNSVVLSGTKATINSLVAQIETQGIEIRPLNVSHAFHSPLMQPMLEEFETVASQINYSSPKLKIISNVTGEVIKEEIATAQYWLNYIRNTVQFQRGIETLERLECNAFLEIGVKPTLIGMARSILSDSEKLWLASLNPKQSDWQQMLESLSRLYLHGVEIDWTAFYQDYPACRVSLPTYPFERQRYWFDVGEKRANFFPVKTDIANHLDQGNIQSLIQQLENVRDFSPEQQTLLPEILKALTDEHQRQRSFPEQKNNLENLYQIEWQLQARNWELEQDFLESEVWLIFADRGSLGAALARYLEAQSQNCWLVYPQDIYLASQPGIYSINPTSRNDFQSLFQDLLLNKKLALKGVIHCWNLDLNLSEDLTISALEKSQTTGCTSLLHLIQTMLAFNEIILPRLWLVTRGAIAIEQELTNPIQASAWGFAKVIGLEHPDLWGGAIDLDPETPVEQAATKILGEINHNQGEELLAFRQEERYVARLVRKKLPAFSPYQVSPNDSYLITGGLGFLGLKVAQSLVEQGAKHLILVSRQGLPQNHKTAKQVKAIQTLEKLGAEVMIAKADVADGEQMSSLFAKLEKQQHSIKGIIHAAGVENNQFIQNLNSQQLQSTFRPKVLGAWLLHQLTLNIKLDFFICFSSIASVWGSGKQANYAAANSFLDNLAHYRRSLGMSGLSINWGPWTGGGMATEESQQLLSRIGVKSWQPEEAIAIFTRLLNSDLAQITAAKINWEIFKPVYQVTKERTLFSEIDIQNQAQISHSTQSLQLVTQLQNLLPHQRYDFLVSFLQQKVAKILGWSSSQLPAEQEGFAELGMDSLTAVEFKNNLEQDLGWSLSSTLAFNYPNVSALANYILKEVYCAYEQTNNNTPEQLLLNPELEVVEINPAFEEMSEAELALLLDEELENISDMVL